MNYYYSVAGTDVIGPVLSSELHRLAASGALSASTQICQEGSDTWRPLAEVIPLAKPIGIERQAFETQIVDLRSDGGIIPALSKAEEQRQIQANVDDPAIIRRVQEAAAGRDVRSFRLGYNRACPQCAVPLTSKRGERCFTCDAAVLIGSAPPESESEWPQLILNGRALFACVDGGQVVGPTSLSVINFSDLICADSFWFSGLERWVNYRRLLNAWYSNDVESARAIVAQAQTATPPPPLEQQPPVPIWFKIIAAIFSVWLGIYLARHF